jgi:hypothetical protein
MGQRKCITKSRLQKLALIGLAKPKHERVIGLLYGLPLFKASLLIRNFFIELFPVCGK